MPTTTINAITTPESTAKPVVHEDLARLATQLVMRQTMFFATVQERTAAFVALQTSPYPGAVCYVSSLRRHEWWTGAHWVPMPGTVVARLRRTTATVIANNSPIPFDTHDFDLLGGHSTTSNITRYTPPIPGRFEVTALARHQPMSGGTSLALWLAKNAVSLNPQFNASANASISAGNGLIISDVVEFDGVSDYVEVSIGNSLATAPNCQHSIMIIKYVGAA